MLRVINRIRVLSKIKFHLGFVIIFLTLFDSCQKTLNVSYYECDSENCTYTFASDDNTIHIMMDKYNNTRYIITMKFIFMQTIVMIEQEKPR